MGVHLEDGFYIVLGNLVDKLSVGISGVLKREFSEYNFTDPTRAVRFRVICGGVKSEGCDYLSYYQRESTSMYRRYRIIKNIDQLRTDLLPYSERS